MRFEPRASEVFHSIKLSDIRPLGQIVVVAAKRILGLCQKSNF